MSDLAAALQVAIRVHADQRDKQGEPYLLHVLRVVEAVSDEAKVVAALHDVFEDREETVMLNGVGLGVEEVLALVLLTREPSQVYAEYISDIGKDELAREVKIADLHDNLGRIPAGDPDWLSLKRRYEKALESLETA